MVDGTRVDLSSGTRGDSPLSMAGTALLTDRYELTMLKAAIRSGVADKPATFEVFSRHLPEGRSYGVVAGIGRLRDAIQAFRFDASQIDFVKQSGISDNETLTFLRDFEFSGSIDGYPEGELYFPHSPVLTIHSSFGEGLLLETLILSILNFDSAVASAASRMRCAARGQRLIEMGSRRTHEIAALAAARAAYIAGFDSTSNMEAGRSYGIPTAGTVAHSFVLAFPTEREAFKAQLEDQGTSTTALIDTFDIRQGIETAISVFGPDLSAIRIDSGDPTYESVAARNLLDSLGAKSTQIVVSGDLDEYKISQLANLPIDAFGVGTRLVTGSGSGTANFVYKLVEIDGPSGLRSVQKNSEFKGNRGGGKVAFRQLDTEGYASAEIVVYRGEQSTLPDDHTFRPLQRRLIHLGKWVADTSLIDSRNLLRRSIEELSPPARGIHGPTAIPTEFRSGQIYTPQ